MTRLGPLVRHQWWPVSPFVSLLSLGFPGGSVSKASACNVGDMGSIPGSERYPWRRKWQPTPAFLPGESHGQRSLVGFSPWGRKESGTTARLTLIVPDSLGSQEVPGVTGNFGLGVQNEAGQRLTEFHQENALVTANTLFQQHKRRLHMDITRWSIPKSD